MGGVAVGCTPDAGPADGDGLAQIQDVADALCAAMAARDRSGFEAAGSAEALEQLWQVTGLGAPLQIDRIEVIGWREIDGRTGVDCRWHWRWPDDPMRAGSGVAAGAVSELPMTLVRRGQRWLVGGLVPVASAPAWWSGAVESIRPLDLAGGVSSVVVVRPGPGVDLAPVWTERWAAAGQRLAERGRHGVLAAGCPVVLELGSGEDLGGLAARTSRVAGEPPAYTITLAADQLADQGDEPAITLLHHELIHAVSGSPDAAAPLWIIEGYAEWHALAGSPGSAQLIRERVLPRWQGGDPAVPEDADFSATDLDVAYARAWSAMLALEELVGVDALEAVVAAAYRGELDRGLRRAGVGLEEINAAAARVR
ncbi:hypothetical protein [Parenemella sanctibonifatiensis]|uniref:Peptidase MA-like domain-containing protein n=1 Tax=Parenemella sanctibonifatiensis TaxID=2016505 RepID=A0A255EJ47_9ACTN|nr:hypothetical protein [Parenemella sanctibonifatiensis]OYN89645.1 hypothetical protein CGZ92_02715 [Parenemella sanctibonifatiensis]